MVPPTCQYTVRQIRTRYFFDKDWTTAPSKVKLLPDLSTRTWNNSLFFCKIPGVPNEMVCRSWFADQRLTASSRNNNCNVYGRTGAGKEIFLSLQNSFSERVSNSRVILHIRGHCHCLLSCLYSAERDLVQSGQAHVRGQMRQTERILYDLSIDGILRKIF